MKLIKNLEKYILVAVAIFFAVFVLPRFPSSYVIPKEIFGVVAISLVLILWSIRSIIKGETSFSVGKFDLGVLLLAAAYVISALVKTSRMEAFLFPGNVTFVIIACLIYFLINQLDKKTKGLILIALFTSGILLSISSLFTQLGIFAKIPQLPSFLKDSLFSPVGGNLPAAMYLAAILPLGIVWVIKEKDLVKKIFFGVASIIIVFGLVLLITTLFPGKSQAFLLPSLQTTWEITIESLKQSPIWGVGAGNYLTAFNLYRPVAYNGTALWMARFSTANNFYFTLVTEVGFAGLFALIVLLVSSYKVFLTDLKQKHWEEISAVLLFVFFAVLPSAPVLIFLLMALLGIFSRSEEKSVSLATTRVPSVIIATPIILGIIALGFFGTKAVMAEMTYSKSLVALNQNNAKETYDLMVKATTQNPYVDRYHASFAQIDMALATSLASKKDLTDTDRQTISQLIQQAIDEGKATVSLNPGRSGNWEVLAQIYRSIMSFAQGADQFTVQTYTQAVALDPINPNLRIALGGTYYALGQYDKAIDAFKLAVLAKSDLANAHYNLAIAYREKKDYDDAIIEINSVLNLVDKNSSDYTLAKSTLDDLQKNKPAAAKTTTGASLTTPTQTTTTIKPPITLPQEATPPAATQ